MKALHRWPVALVSAFLLLGFVLAAGALGFSRSVTPGLIANLQARFGQGAKGRVEGWGSFVRETEGRAKARVGADEGELLRPVNGFFNRVPAIEDIEHWGVEDYWATPAESLASNGADCEDFAIAKYFTLKELGVPVGRLRIVYARATQARTAHMVLAYYRTPQSDPLILDNVDGTIRPAADRPDLIPVYTFNDEDLLLNQQGQPALRVNAASNRKWRDLLARLEMELRL
jgi:predicted transglutaminase-like cysteine proteinase